MPCDSTVRVTIDAGKMDPEAVLRALVAEGFSARINGRTVYWSDKGVSHTYNADTGQVSASGRSITESDMTNLKQVYGKQIVRDQAAKFGWQLKPVGANKFKVVKRF